MRAAGSKLKHRCDAANALSSDDRWSVADMLKGELQAVCGVADASRRVAELQLLNERKDRFIAILAHELRRPVAPIANTSGSSGGASGDSQLVIGACAPCGARPYVCLAASAWFADGNRHSVLRHSGGS